jgi:hypothetical protein
MSDRKKSGNKTRNIIVTIIVSILISSIVLCSLCFYYSYYRARSKHKITTPVIKGIVVDNESHRPIDGAYIYAQWNILEPQETGVFGQLGFTDQVVAGLTRWTTKTAHDGSFTLSRQSAELKPVGGLASQDAGTITITATSLGRKCRIFVLLYPGNKKELKEYDEVPIYYHTKNIDLGEIKMSKLHSEQEYWDYLTKSGESIKSQLINIGGPFELKPLPDSYAFVMAEYANYLALYPTSDNKDDVEFDLKRTFVDKRDDKTKHQVANAIRNILSNNPKMPGYELLKDVLNELE